MLFEDTDGYIGVCNGKCATRYKYTRSITIFSGGRIVARYRSYLCCCYGAFNRYIAAGSRQQAEGGLLLFLLFLAPLQMHFSFRKKATSLPLTHYHDLFSVCILYPDVAAITLKLLGWYLSAIQSIIVPIMAQSLEFWRQKL